RVWTWTKERGNMRDLMLSGGYVGSASYPTPLNQNSNAPMPVICQDAQGCISGGTGTNGNPVPVTQQGRVAQGTLYHPPAYRPNPNVGSGTQWFNQGTSSYHGMAFSLPNPTTPTLTFT